MPAASTRFTRESTKRTASRLPGHPSKTAPCLTLLRMGFTQPNRSPCLLVSSYLTVSPLPRNDDRRIITRSAVCFLLHLPWSHDRSALPTILSCGARTFLQLLSNQRPLDRLARDTVAEIDFSSQTQTVAFLFLASQIVPDCRTEPSVQLAKPVSIAYSANCRSSLRDFPIFAIRTLNRALRLSGPCCLL